jgi:hypothetical protein
LKLGQPLFPVTYAPKYVNGQFELQIALPEDIKDTTTTIKTIHDSWGLLIPFARRKITHEANVNLTSCFGCTTLSTTPATVSARLVTTTEISTGHPLESMSPTANPVAPEEVKGTSKVTSDPESLIGKEVSIAGDRWAGPYKGKMYAGSIVSCNKSEEDDYVYFDLRFDDCTETMYLDELLELALISQDDYNILAPTCNPPSE